MNIIIRIITYFLRERLTDVLFYRHFKDLDPGGIAIDCRADVGVITARLAQTGIRVYAFDLNPYASKRLKEKVSGYENVTRIRLSWL